MSSELFRSTGIAGLDQVIQGLRLGDNVVMQVEQIEDAQPFIEPFVREALEHGIPIIYFRFALHMEPLVDDEHVEVVQLNPELGFERFVTTILDLAEARGVGVYYVFDSLSELAVDWCSDQMLANFFMIVCPALYRLDTIAYFAMIRNRHMQRTVENISRTAQVILDVYRNKEQLYVQPLKVQDRYSPTMFMLHSWATRELIPVTNSATLTEIMANLPHSWLEFSLHRPGVWRRTVMHAQETLADLNSGKLTPREAEDCFMRLVRMAITRDERYIQLVSRYFTLADLMRILTRMIGSGLIGGKALGMLLARAMLVRTDSRWNDFLEVHDSFFIGSDVFYTYIVQSGCWWSRRVRHDPEALFDRIEEGQHCLLKGEFPQYLVNQFKEMLNYFGQSPIIVRSSSILEDNFGNAFSGKYESVFCPNQGPLSARLEQFMDAVRRIYASALSQEALAYRDHRGLLEQDEQMALLVQRVSGTVYDKIFFPHVAGVGYSFNPYVWDKQIDPKAGLLRIVCGLGTRAVDRIEDDYTRLVALNAPDRRVETSQEQARQYSQQQVDVLDLDTNCLRSIPFQQIVESADGLPLEMLAVRDQELLKRAAQQKMKNVFPWVLTFDGLIQQTSFVPRIRQMMQQLEKAYNYPVDIEFTVNFVEGQRFRLNLLQCRPFQVRSESGETIPLPGETLKAEDVILSTTGPVIGQSRSIPIDHIIHVVPSVYARLPNSKRFALARLIGRLTQVEAMSQRILLIGPGRWGTTTPAFGVPVTFQEIRRVAVICEVAVMHEGLIPDISLGTHFFNDLVELDMLYTAVFPEKEGHQVNQSLLLSLPNRLTEMLPAAENWQDALRLVNAADLSPRSIRMYADSVEQRVICFVQERSS